MISQREARRLQKRVRELEASSRNQNNAWIRDYPGGVHISCLTIPTEDYTAIHTARKLGHAVVVTTSTRGQIDFYANILPKV